MEGAARNKVEEGGVKCVTELTRFGTVYLDEEVLKSVLVVLHDQQCSSLEEPVSNR